MFALVDRAYLYDGSFEGLLCCVFEGFLRRERPVQILPAGEPTLYPAREIATRRERAERVLLGMERKISAEAAELVQLGFLSCEPERERLIFDFVCHAFDVGRLAADDRASDIVSRLQKAVFHLEHEAHMLTGFVRFSEQNGTLAAVVSPKNHALFLMREHFCTRFGEERFLIYDNVHREALVYQPYQSAIVPLEGFVLDAPDETEQRYQTLWKRFYDTIAIEERYNPRCRMNLCAKRYWRNMTELKGEVPAGPPDYLAAYGLGEDRARIPFAPSEKLPLRPAPWQRKGIPRMPYPGSRGFAQRTLESEQQAGQRPGRIVEKSCEKLT